MSIAVGDDPAERAERASSPRRFLLNVGSNLLMLVLNSVVGIWLTSYLVQRLGVALYGLVALASAVTLYLSVITTALNNAIGRFLTIDIRQGRFDSANRTFNTALWGSVAVCLLTLPAVGLLAYYTPQIFSVPAGQEQGSRWLFVAVMLAYLIGVVRGVFTVSTFVHSRFDLQNLVLATNLIVRLLLVVALFALFAPSLSAVGAATVVATLGSFGVAWLIWRRLTPELSVAPRAFDLGYLRTISGTSVWFFINQVGTLLFLNIDLVVVNMLLGAEAGGRYGIVLQWPLLLRTLATTVSSVLTPTILAQHARGDAAAVAHTTRQSVKLMGLAIALPVGLIVGLAGTLLTIWLGPEFADLAPLLIVLVGPLCLNVAVQPLFSTQVALNRVRWPGLATLVMGLLNLLLAIWWAGWLPGGLGVALAGATLLSAKSITFTAIYGAHIQGLPWQTFIVATLPGLLIAAAVAALALLLDWLLPIGSWVALGAVGALVALVYAVVVYALVLGGEERRLLQRLLSRSKR